MGALKRELPRWRLAVIGAGLAVCVVVLIVRAIDLQVLQRDFLQGEGDARHVRTLPDVAMRGPIVDRNGEILAMSAPVDSIWAHPTTVLAQPGGVQRLATALSRDPDELEHFLRGRAGREFVWVQRQLSPEAAESVLALRIAGVHAQREYRRFYPHGESAAQIVGLANIDERGIEGVEAVFDSWLTGSDGAKRVVRDRHGRHARDVAQLRSVQHGRELRLTIDQRLQYVAHLELKNQVERHKAKGGAAILLDARSGEVLAMVSMPTGNPNDRASLDPRRLRNQVVTDAFEPGSVIKPLTVAAALDAGVVRPDAVLHTSPGTMRVGTLTVRDFRNYGSIDLATLIARSSNVGATQLAFAMSPGEYWAALQRVGLGERTGLPLPGEAAGLLRDFTTWRRVEHATMSYGYGLSTSLAQLAAAYLPFANHGVRLPLTLVELADDPREPVQAMGGETADRVLEMMERTISIHGTARQAAIRGYRVAGKTGTSRKAGVGGYSEDRYRSVFIGLAPASRPRFVMAVMIDEPGAGEYYGGVVAAPVFAAVVERALALYGVTPDALPGEGMKIVLGEPVDAPAAGVNRNDTLAARLPQGLGLVGGRQ